VNDDEHEIMHAINYDPEETAKSCYILYVEHAFARKINYDKIIIDLADKKFRRSPTT